MSSSLQGLYGYNFFQQTMQFEWAFSCSFAEYWLDWLFVLWLAQDHLASFAPTYADTYPCASVYG